MIMIAVASWVLYRYLAPKSWREWAGAGLVQAFLIALYAEMYGFPLTIYLVARFSGLDRPDLNASLWSTLPGVPDLTAQNNRLANSDATLLQRIRDGYQSPGSPMAMPPKGGNASLTDDDLKAVIDYMRRTFGR